MTSPQPQPQPTRPQQVACYVDGFNLYNGMHDARKRRGLWLDLESMLGSLLQAGQQLAAVHYFTALVHGPGQVHQQTYLDALAAHGTVTSTHVGRFQHKHQQCRACGARSPRWRPRPRSRRADRPTPAEVGQSRGRGD